jgi:sortase A
MPPVHRLRSLLPWLERALWTLAAVCLLTVAWSWTDARAYQQRADHELARAIADAPADEGPPHAATAGARAVPAGEMPTLGGAASAEERFPAVPSGAPAADGEPLARILVPRFDLSAVVAEGTGSRVLQRAVGHVATSAPPGGDGNVVLAAHRDTFFRPLEHILPGDEVVLESPAGRHLYRVEWTRVVEPSETSVAEDAGYPALTLVTCYPFRWVGTAPLRFIVRARRHG